jgi:hypothetical protein
MSWTLQAQDDFTDAALTAIDAHTPTPSGGFTWANLNGFPRIDINGTAFNAGGAVEGIAKCGKTLGNKQACEITLTSTSIGVGVCGDGSKDGYVYFARDGLSSYLQRYDAGSPTNLATGGASASAGDVIRLEFDGVNAIQAYINGVATLSATDGTYVGGSAWLSCSPGSKADNFNAYDQSAAPAASHLLGLLGVGG